MRFRVHMPTRSRPAQALKVAHMYMALTSRQHQVSMSFATDADDPSMNSVGTRQRFSTLGRVHVGNHATKVEAINAGIDRDFDVLLLASDDMVPVCRGWDDLVAQAMRRHYPNLDGALHFNDGRRGRELCTFPIMGVNLYKKFGYVYDPSYKSLWCDNEYTEILQAMRRLEYVDQVLFRHDHPAFGAKTDALYKRNEALMAEDHAVYLARRPLRAPGSTLPFGAPPVRLSLLVCSIESRAEQLRHLLAHLNDQINAGDHIREVEICVATDNGRQSVGAKRNALLERAIGDYVAFIDDDDLVAPWYVKNAVALLRANPGVDVLGFTGRITTGGRDPRTFEHALRCGRWYEEGGVYFRTPNHLNPVRRDLALQVRFPELNCGEDRDYSDRLFPLLKTEAILAGDGPAYFYRFDPQKTATQRR